MTSTSSCRSCQRPIIWAKTVSGKNMPLDPKPVLDGNVELLDNVAHVIAARDVGNTMRFVSHFRTCPNADQHRRKR